MFNCEKMKYISVIIITLIIGCCTSKLPKERLSQFKLDNRYEFKDNELTVYLNNVLQITKKKNLIFLSLQTYLPILDALASSKVRSAAKGKINPSVKF